MYLEHVRCNCTIKICIKNLFGKFYIGIIVKIFETNFDGTVILISCITLFLILSPSIFLSEIRYFVSTYIECNLERKIAL